jgi:hypothetical protein
LTVLDVTGTRVMASAVAELPDCEVIHEPVPAK